MAHAPIQPDLAATSPARVPWCLLLVPLALTAAVYWQVWRFNFVELDDPQYVYTNYTLASVTGIDAWRYAFTTFLGGNWHPLVWLSFLFDRWAWHLRPGPMHVENAVLHGLSATLVLLLIAEATGAVRRAAVCAALFAVHPAHVESVAWISERKDVLSTVWLLAAMLGYARYTRGSPRCRWAWYAGMIVCYALSLASKSMGVTLPFVLLLLDAWPLSRLRGRMAWRVVEKLPLFAMAAATAVVTVVAQHSAGAMSGNAGDGPLSHAANAAVSYVAYVASLFWPARLAVFYPPRAVPGQAAVAAALLLVAATWVAARVRVRRPYALVGWLWFAGTLVPVIGFVQVGQQAMADRYTYFPSIGLSIAVVWLAADLFALVGRWLAPTVTVAVVGALAVAGRGQLRHWRDNLALFTHAAEVTEDNYVAWDFLAREALRRQDLETAGRYLTRAIQAKPDFATAYADLGRCRAAEGQQGAAVLAFEAAVRFAPASASYRSGLAVSLEAIGRHAEAVAAAEAAVAVDPGSPTARATLARLKP